ncbi:PA14 domain-containing protein [Tellurirhabdus rosea]|uniref:hypothetical protein n=1 Tax=Tellurirhabdus rosea TaxID=2674997 RepID=UPI002250C7CD|nr:hypothetical protein [Tellurirhabdus rosea]
MTYFSGRRVLAAAGLLLLGLNAGAQTGTEALLPVKISATALPKSWRWIGAISAAPDASSFTTKPGTAYLLGGREPLNVLQVNDDFRMRFDVMMTQGGDVELSLPNGSTLSLLHSPDLNRILKAPGLWQTVDLRYRAATGAQPALLEKLVINGVTVREDQRLAPAKATGSVALWSPNGSLAVRDMAYQILSNRQVARLGNVRYKLYEGEAEKAADLSAKKPLQEGTLPAITHEVAYGQTKRYSIVYTGELEVLQDGPLTFTVQQGGIAGIQVDGKDVIAPTYADLGQPQTAQTTLKAGKYPVTVFFSRSWPRPGLGVFVSGPGTRPQALHPQASLPEPDPVGLIAVRAADRPSLIRSFIQLPNEKKKRTHCLSVGTPAGQHYTMDLNQGALLQVWKGDFADVTEMWHERGEPQLLKPIGTLVSLGGQPTLAALNDANQVWPDSLNDEKDFLYKGWKLDADGYPTLQYSYRGAAISDFIKPISNGLSRTLTVNGGPGLYCRLAAGKDVEEVRKGLYAVDNHSYYIQLDPKAKPVIRNNRELLLPVSNGTIQYSIIW